MSNKIFEPKNETQVELAKIQLSDFVFMRDIPTTIHTYNYKEGDIIYVFLNFNNSVYLFDNNVTYLGYTAGSTYRNHFIQNNNGKIQFYYTHGNNEQEVIESNLILTIYHK